MKFYLLNKKNQARKKILTAFTLIELLVSISVLAAIAAISVSSYPKFSEQLGLTAESYKIVSYLREAQVYGSAGYTDPGIKVVYGLEIIRETDTEKNLIRKVQWQNPNSTTNQKYVDNKTDTGETTLQIGNKYEIEKICSIAGTQNSCEQNQNYTKAYVFFKRPNPEGRLIGIVGTILYPNQNSSAGLQKLELSLRSKRDIQFVKKIVILQTGQMYVE